MRNFDARFLPITGNPNYHHMPIKSVCDVTRCIVYSYFVDMFSAVLFSCGACTNKIKPSLSGVNHTLTYPPWQFDKECPLCVMWVLSWYSPCLSVNLAANLSDHIGLVLLEFCSVTSYKQKCWGLYFENMSMQTAVNKMSCHITNSQDLMGMWW